MPTATPTRPAAPRRTASRWWLAGLLVGCLLPAGLAQVDGARQAERIAQIRELAPALIRAGSRWQARRRALVGWPTRVGWLVATARRVPLLPPPPTPMTAALDVLTRRGPPAWPNHR